ncbi:DEAD/DEAH box helicase family protein [Alkalibacterium iburiense]|uniref:DEAD/DEAH box helicase family protein n=1 Tax=Alkalibacterium iburiense TaxID=290589 RepID=A0ABP3HBR9_9LACT
MSKSIEQENKKLKKEVKLLKERVSILEAEIQEYKGTVLNETTIDNQVNPASNGFIKNKESDTSFNKFASPAEKIKLYRSLFKGREDVYAQKFIHSQTGRVGYAPAKLPYWERSKDREYEPFNFNVAERHLKGEKNFVAGLFPITLDDTCYFLAIDLDNKEWEKDVTALREVCAEHTIPICVERSQSGDGAHVWFFFSSDQKASIARKFGTELIKAAMSKRHELDFASFDRLFPNQDTVPKGGFGNLIALPLQKEARKNGNSVFIDEGFEAYPDQWAYLASIQKIPNEELSKYIEILVRENGEQENMGTKKAKNTKISDKDFSATVTVILSNMIYISKKGISSKGLSHLKWMAAFYNPEFYQLQAMRRSTYRVQRIIACHEETAEHIILPRGLKDEIIYLLDTNNVTYRVNDDRNIGKTLPVSFKGELWPQQKEAVSKMLEHDTGILSGSTAFGKTVAALNMITERKVNTLILVNKVSLANQWKKRICEFLEWQGDETEDSFVGQLGGGKKKLSSKIDVALLQSLYRKGEVHECVENYGMVIVDECHHISAFSFESVLKQVNAKYVYGLTATPKRKDGHQPIIHMQCGDIRFQDNAKEQARERPFDHTLVTRFTPLDPTISNEQPVQSVYSQLVENDVRNEMIARDIIDQNKENRYNLVLTERIEHIEKLKDLLADKLKYLFVLTGSKGAKHNRETMEKIENLSDGKPFTILSTGKYIGEGFDEARLDTLFIAMPISWKGRVQQYAGRLHRLHESKEEVRIFDYADIHVPVLERMYQKRLTGYASMGYTINVDGQDDKRQSIFETDTYFDTLKKDMKNAKKEIMISSPSLSKKQIKQFQNKFSSKEANILISTKESSDIKNKNHRESRKIAINKLQKAGYSLLLKENSYHRCVIIDHSIIWYGSIDLLGYSKKEGSFIRIESPVLAKEMEAAVLDNEYEKLD